MHFFYFISFGIFAQVKANSTESTNIVLVGHIGAEGALPNYEKVLHLSRKELRQDGTLGEDFDIKIISRSGCREYLEGVAAAADLYHVQHVTAFLGPHCSSELLPVAAMANFWNIPALAYMSADNVLSSNGLNRTLIRVSSRSINTTAESTAAFIKHYKWKEVSLVTNMGTSAYERMVVFETVLKRQGINITRKILFEESATLNDMISGGQLEEIRQNSKVVIVFFSSTRDLGAIFREASNKYGLSESEFVFIFPWLPEAVYGASPIAGSDTSILEKVKETYSNCVLIEDTNAFDDGTITTFLEKIGSVGLEEKDIDMNNIYGYTALFDAFKALAIAGRRILNSTGDLSSVKEGKKMWNAMRRMTFAGTKSVK